jgi:hypothetical protein
VRSGQPTAWCGRLHHAVDVVREGSATSTSRPLCKACVKAMAKALLKKGDVAFVDEVQCR